MSSPLGAFAYPVRGDHFAFRFCRLLTKTAAALEVGAEGCWLLTVVVMQEDACRYRRAVRFFNEQLMGLVGMTRLKTFLALRDRLVAAGWLHYQTGGTRQAGVYYVAVPAHATGIEDGVTAETGAGLVAAAAINPARNGASNRAAIAPATEQESRQQSGTNTAPPPSLSLALTPSPSDRERDGAAPRRNRLERLLDQLLVSNSARQRDRWCALAQNEGRADNAEEILACIEWAVDRARGEGRTVNHPNHVIAEARLWATTRLPAMRKKGGAA